MVTLRERVLAYASRPESEAVLFSAAFAEGVFAPVSADALLVPMVLVNPDRAFRYAAIATAGSVLGAMVSFVLGFLIFKAIGEALIDQYQLHQAFAFFHSVFADYNVLLVVAAGLATIPFKFLTVISGFFGAWVPTFMLASVFSRAIHYFLMAWVLWRGGVRYKEWTDNYFQGLSLVMALGLLLVFVMILLLVRTA